MTRIVIDASVTLSWCFPDEQTLMSMNVLDRLKAGDQALVPAFWALEVLNTLLVGERKGRITAEQTRVFFDTLRILNPTLDHAADSAEHLHPSARPNRSSFQTASVSRGNWTLPAA